MKFILVLITVSFCLGLVFSNNAFANCDYGENQCGPDGYLRKCVRMSEAMNDFAWRSTMIRCSGNIENIRVCEPGFERCSPDGVIQKCAYSGERWQNQPYRQCQAGSQVTIEQERVN